MKFDNKDKQIILALDYNARNSYSKIAKELKLSKDLVISRLKKLEKSGLIEGYYSIIDYYSLGFKTYKLYIKLNRIDSNLEEEILEYLKFYLEARFLSFLSNDFDILITFNVLDEISFFNIYREFIFKFADFILNKDLAIITSQRHFLQPILNSDDKNKVFISKFNYASNLNSKITNKTDTNNKNTTNKNGNTNLIILNELEKKLLKIISLDAKIKFTELALKLDKNVSSLLYILKSLEKRKIILGYRPRINFGKLEKSHYIISLNFKSLKSFEYSSIIKLISSMTGIIYISECIGSYDLEFELVSTNNFEMMNEINILKKEYSIILAKINIRNVLKTHTLNYSPF